MTPREQRLREMARDVIALMQSGPIADVSPERTETIIAAALGQAIDLAREEAFAESIAICAKWANTYNGDAAGFASDEIQKRGAP